MKLIRIFFTGMLISFLGTIPLGTLNVAAMQISVSDGVTQALYFSLGALLVEIIYVRISLVGMNWVRKQKKLFRWLEWITLAIIVALAVSSFIAALSPSHHKNQILSNTLPRFELGLMMSAVNPMQIPFWFGWSTVLFTKKILAPQNSQYNAYIGGIGIGTFAGNSIFIFGGQLLVGALNKNQNIINWIIGGIFAATALIQFFKILFTKSASEKLEQVN